MFSPALRAAAVAGVISRVDCHGTPSVVRLTHFSEAPGAYRHVAAALAYPMYTQTGAALGTALEDIG